MTEQIRIVDHPLVATGLSVLRARTTAPDVFRRHVQEIAILLFAEASRSWSTKRIEVETPLASCAGVVLEKPIVLVPISGPVSECWMEFCGLAPEASVGHIGLYRRRGNTPACQLL